MTKRDTQAAEYAADRAEGPDVDICVKLRRARANMLGTDDEELYWACHDAAEEVERLRSVAPRWVPVTERLPGEYETVLVATGGSVSAGEIRFPDDEDGMSESWWMVFKDRRDTSPAAWAGFVKDVTHWMPLPEPPEVT